MRSVSFLSEHAEPISNGSSTTDQSVSLTTDETTNSGSLPQLSDEAKSRILALIKDLGQKTISSTDLNSSPIKLAFVDNLYLCSTCSGVAHWV